MQLTKQDAALIDEHFAFAELGRSYGPSGIYHRVQSFIENGGLDEARQRHGVPCELFDGYRSCRCQERRGYTHEEQPDGSVKVIPNRA